MTFPRRPERRHHRTSNALPEHRELAWRALFDGDEETWGAEKKRILTAWREGTEPLNSCAGLLRDLYDTDTDRDGRDLAAARLADLYGAANAEYVSTIEWVRQHLEALYKSRGETLDADLNAEIARFKMHKQTAQTLRGVYAALRRAAQMVPQHHVRARTRRFRGALSTVGQRGRSSRPARNPRTPGSRRTSGTRAGPDDDDPEPESEPAHRGPYQAAPTSLAAPFSTRYGHVNAPLRRFLGERGWL